MSSTDDMSKFLDEINAAPAPEPKAAKPKEKEKKPPKPLAADESGLDTKKTSLRTDLKRVIFNESGITEAVDQIDRLPAEGEAIHTIMGGHFNGFDVIPALQRMSDEPLTHLTIATLGFNLRNNKNLCQMIDDGLIEGPVTLVCSMVFAQMDKNVYRQAKENLESRGGKMAFTRNHAKIVTCQAAGRYLTTEGSGNLRSCNSLEQLQIINSREVHEFHTRWIHQIAEENHVKS